MADTSVRQGLLARMASGAQKELLRRNPALRGKFSATSSQIVDDASGFLFVCLFVFFNFCGRGFVLRLFLCWAIPGM